MDPDFEEGWTRGRRQYLATRKTHGYGKDADSWASSHESHPSPRRVRQWHAGYRLGQWGPAHSTLIDAWSAHIVALTLAVAHRWVDTGRGYVVTPRP